MEPIDETLKSAADSDDIDLIERFNRLRMSNNAINNNNNSTQPTAHNPFLQMMAVNPINMSNPEISNVNNSSANQLDERQTDDDGDSSEDSKTNELDTTGQFIATPIQFVTN